MTIWIAGWTRTDECSSMLAFFSIDLTGLITRRSFWRRYGFPNLSSIVFLCRKNRPSAQVFELRAKSTLIPIES